MGSLHYVKLNDNRCQNIETACHLSCIVIYESTFGENTNRIQVCACQSNCWEMSPQFKLTMEIMQTHWEYIPRNRNIRHFA